MISVISWTLEWLTGLGVIGSVNMDVALPGSAKGSDGTPPIDLIVEDFFADERRYICQLQELVAAKEHLESNALLSGNKLHSIFTPLEKTLEFHRRFLLDMEVNLLKLSDDRRWYTPFQIWERHSEIYGIVVFNEKGNKETLRNLLDGARAPVSQVLANCLALMSLPSQRLPKYSAVLQVCDFLSPQPLPTKSLIGNVAPG